MWFITSWIMRKRYGNLPFKIRNFTESYQSECRESIKTSFKVITRKKEDIWVRIKLKDAKNKMHSQTTNILGGREKLNKPIFTEDEVRSNSRYQILYWVILLLFIGFETVFYSFFGNFLLPKTIRTVEAVYVSALTLAIIFAILLHLGFQWIFEYLEAKYVVEKHKLNKIELKPFFPKLLLGIVFCVLFIVVNLAAGFLRADLLDPVSTLTNKELVEKIEIPWRIFSVLLTLAVALAMAGLEKELASKAKLLAVYKNWKRQQKERKKYNSEIKNMLRSCEQEKSLAVEKYWGIAKDLQRIFRIEIDADQKELLADLIEKIEQNPDFLENLDEQNYQRYLPVAVTRRELFVHGIESDTDITAIIADLQAKVKVIEAFEAANAKTETTEENEDIDKNDDELSEEIPKPLIVSEAVNN